MRRLTGRFNQGLIVVVLAVIFSMSATGCTESVDDATMPDSDDSAMRADDDTVADRDDATPVSPPDPGEVELAAESSSLFGFDMFNGLADASPDENVVTSPYSAAMLLTMLLNGADGETRAAIGEVLRLPDPFDDEINEQHFTLATYLESADDIELSIANSLWAASGHPFEDDYVENMESWFNAAVREVDLASQEAADEIDSWVREQTRDRIDGIAEDLGLPDPASVMVLLNAVYFLGDWTEPFDPERTYDGAFTLPDGSEIQTPLMVRDGQFRFTEMDDFSAIQLPYGDEERFAMEIFLPASGLTLEEFRASFSHENWHASVENLTEQRVELTLPSFELEYNTGADLKRTLDDLGMGIAFTGEADFSAMSPASIWLDSVVQKTFIRVDEVGTEAAAVTGGDMVASMPPQMRVDRPFLFTISDTHTGALLFLGQVADPSR
jgi:serine protease inhibitor